MIASALETFLVGQPAAIAKLLARHVEDGRGRCRCCGIGSQQGFQPWPCTIYAAAERAAAIRDAVSTHTRDLPRMVKDDAEAGTVTVMSEPRPPETTYLLITRTGGKSASRYQRAFRTVEDVQAAVERRRKAGADAFWIYGPPAEPGAARILQRHWTLPRPTADSSE